MSSSDNRKAAAWADPLESLAGRRLALVVTGGIAAYKAAELARLWVRAGALVRTIMTPAATRFITPLTFEALTGQPVAVDMWERSQVEVEHIAWADWAEAAVAAPATADFLAKLAHGLADDFASAFMLAFTGPKLAAPAMNSHMYQAPATRENLERLSRYGYTLIDPAEGLLACGAAGTGRLAAPPEIALAAAKALGPGDLAGLTLTVSAGASREPWDDIRCLTNRSTGLMGLSLARAGWLRGASVTLLAGPAVPAGPNLPGFRTIAFESTEDLLEAARAVLPDTRVLIMAAAPADFKPAARVAGKIKKGGGPPALELAATPDILKTLSPHKGSCLFIGFAAEADHLLDQAAAKLRAKNLDLMVANQARTAFGSPDNQLWLLDPAGGVTEISPRPKFAAAWAVLDRVAALLAA